MYIIHNTLSESKPGVGEPQSELLQLEYKKNEIVEINSMEHLTRLRPCRFEFRRTATLAVWLVYTGVSPNVVSIMLNIMESIPLSRSMTLISRLHNNQIVL